MPIRQPTLAELERLRLLYTLPAHAKIATRDAALLRGVSLATWQRMRARGETPRAYRINGNSDAFEVGAVLAMPETNIEEPAAA